MRRLRQLERYRVRIPGHPHSEGPEDECGTFLLESPVRPTEWLRAIATVGSGWDHVSVSVMNRIPTWEEMNFVKLVFFREDEWAVQYHPAVADHINCHPFCLHIWRPHKPFPVPPKDFV